MSTRVEILMLAFSIFGLFGLGFWLVMFRLWISRFTGLSLARLMIEGMAMIVGFVLVRMGMEVVSLIWSGQRVGDYTQASLIITIGLISWVQVVRFTWWWLQQVPQEMVLDDELSAEVDPNEG